MISKELLSNVLGLTVVKVLELDDTILWYKGIVNINGSPYAKELSVNIYELAHKCKEWASKQHYSIMSGWEMTHWGGAYRVEVFRNSNNILFSMSTVDKEPEAIFNACQWILDKDSK